MTMLLLLLLKIVMDASLQIHAAFCFPAPLSQGGALWMTVCVICRLEHLSASSRPIMLLFFFFFSSESEIIISFLVNSECEQEPGFMRSAVRYHCDIPSQS